MIAIDGQVIGAYFSKPNGIRHVVKRRWYCCGLQPKLVVENSDILMKNKAFFLQTLSYLQNVILNLF